MKRALITGSEGFAGGHLREELESNGYEVYGTSLASPGVPSEKIIVCDITDEDRVTSLIKSLQPNYIFHLAAQPSPFRSWQNPQETLEINTVGTINLLEAVRRIDVYKPKIVIIGSSAEYGDVPQQNLPITEASEFKPRSPYAVSKLATFYLSLVYAKNYSMDIVYVSPFNHTGPGQSIGFLPTDIASQIVKIEKGEQEPVLLTGYLDNLRDYSDVRDIVRAYRLLAENGKSGERYNICSGKTISTGQIYEILMKNSKVEIEHKVDPKRNNPSDVHVIVGSHEKITRETGWTPEIPIEQTLKDLLDWYRSNN